MVNSSIIKLGDSNSDVLELNQILISKGFLDNKEPDDKFDERTKQGVLLFQKQFGLVQDAIVGDSTQRVLNRIKNYVSGIDVSYYQANVDWDTVSKTNTKFAFARLNDGIKYTDSTFLTNWKQMREHGLYRGVYQYFRPGQDIEKQIEILLTNIIKLENGDFPPVLDIETNKEHFSPADFKTKIDVWIKTVKEALKCNPILYTAAYFWNANVGYIDTYKSLPLWVANYNTPSQTYRTLGINGLFGNMELAKYLG